MDAETFKRIFIPCHDKLYRVAYRYLQNEEDSRDMLQETYLKLWEKRDELKAINSPEAYALTILRNLCLDRLRKPARDQVPLESCEQISEPRGSEEEAEMREQLSQVRIFIRELPDAQRQVICLRHFESYSLEEIEQTTGLSAVNIRVLLSRARKKLKEQFQKLNCYEAR